MSLVFESLFVCVFARRKVQYIDDGQTKFDSFPNTIWFILRKKVNVCERKKFQIWREVKQNETLVMSYQNSQEMMSCTSLLYFMLHQEVNRKEIGKKPIFSIIFQVIQYDPLFHLLIRTENHDFPSISLLLTKTKSTLRTKSSQKTCEAYKRFHLKSFQPKSTESTCMSLFFLSQFNTIYITFFFLSTKQSCYMSKEKTTTTMSRTIIASKRKIYLNKTKDMRHTYTHTKK